MENARTTIKNTYRYYWTL